MVNFGEFWRIFRNKTAGIGHVPFESHAAFASKSESCSQNSNLVVVPSRFVFNAPNCPNCAFEAVGSALALFGLLDAVVSESGLLYAKVNLVF